MDWSKILEAVLVVVLPMLAVSAYRAAGAWVKSVQAKIAAASPSVGEFLELAAGFAVQAAEQAGLADELVIKKDYAVSAASQWLDAHGIYIDVGLISAAIEKAVRDADFPHKDAPQP